VYFAGTYVVVGRNGRREVRRTIERRDDQKGKPSRCRHPPTVTGKINSKPTCPSPDRRREQTWSAIHGGVFNHRLLLNGNDTNITVCRSRPKTISDYFKKQTRERFTFLFIYFFVPKPKENQKIPRGPCIRKADVSRLFFYVRTNMNSLLLVVRR